MRARLISFAAAGSMLILSGCTAIDAELHHSGGYTGKLLDQHYFDASGSKQLQVLRAALIVAMVARAGSEYAHDDSENAQFRQAIYDATTEINVIAGYAVENNSEGLACDLSGQSEKSTPAKGCRTYSANFESEIPLLEKRIFHLTVLALPRRQAMTFLNSIKKGDVLSSALAASKLALAAADGLHTAAAVERTSLEIEAHQLSSGCPNATTVDEAFACLPKRGVGAQNTRAFKATVESPVFEAVMQNIQTSCMKIPVTATEDGAENQSLKDLKTKAIGDCKAKIVYKPTSL